MDKERDDGSTASPEEKSPADEGRRKFLERGVKAAYVAPAVISLVVAKNAAAGSPLPPNPKPPQPPPRP